MDPGPPPVLALFLIPSIVLCILYATSKYHNRRRTEFSTYGLYLTVVRHMLRGDDGKDLACLAYYPQCEVYNSDLDMRNSLAGAADNPDVSLTTQADSSARGVKIDLAVVLHHPYVHVDSPNLPLDGKTSTTINELFEYICDPDNPGGGVFDPTKYSVLRIAQTDLVLYIEIKPPVSRRGDLPTYLRNVHRGVRDATEDADQQFSCAMLSWRYSHCESAWLLGGAGDVFSLRRAIRHGARVFSHRLYVERRRGEMIRRAIDNLSQDGPDEGILDVDSILSSKPPFSDAEIHAFIDENPDHKMYAFERLTSAAGMAKNLYSGNWTKPMRIGSPVANFYMQLVRDDILKRARKEVSRWDDIVDLTQPTSQGAPEEKPRTTLDSDQDSDASTDRDPLKDDDSDYSGMEDAMSPAYDENAAGVVV